MSTLGSTRFSRLLSLSTESDVQDGSWVEVRHSPSLFASTFFCTHMHSMPLPITRTPEFLAKPQQFASSRIQRSAVGYVYHTAHGVLNFLLSEK